jgi:hypothetical protein
MRRRRSDENLRLVAERRWQLWRRRAGQPTEFDEDEGLYHDLADRDPGAAQSLTRRFAERWLAASSIPTGRVEKTSAAVSIE